MGKPLPDRLIYLALAADFYAKGNELSVERASDGSTQPVTLAEVSLFLLSPDKSQSPHLSDKDWARQAFRYKKAIEGMIPRWMDEGRYNLPGCPLEDWPHPLRVKALGR